MSSRRMTEINFDNVAFGRSPTNSVEPPVEENRRSRSPTARAPPEGAAHNPKKRRYIPKQDEKLEPASAEPPTLPTIHESYVSTAWDLQARNESPWDLYEKVFDLDLNGPVTVAQRKAPLSGLVAVRRFSLTAAEKALFTHKRIRHDCIVEALDAFTTESSFYVILEHMPISLEQIVDSVKYPTERQLAAILGQILDGLIFLEDEGLEHGSLTCPNILLSNKGHVKIANQQYCNKCEGDREPRDVRALGVIMMELMQKYTQENGAVGVENLDRWPSDSKAVTFLSETTSAGSARHLKRHALLKIRSRKEDLIALIFLAEVSARRNYACSA